MTLRVDRGDLDRWVAKMDQAISDTPNEAAKVVAKGALNIKNGARQRISGHPSAPAYPSSITYDTWMGLRGPMAEIGPDKNRRQGALGNILEYGTVKNAPIPHIKPAADEELPRFEAAMEDLAGRVLGL